MRATPYASATLIYCSSCGDQMASNAVSCPRCGAFNPYVRASISDKDWLAALLLCLFLGTFGVHRFYVGKVFTGLLQIFTLGGLGIWAMIDLILIIAGVFKDDQGLPLKRG